MTQSITAFERDMSNLQKELNDFVITEYGEDAWVCIDDIRFDFFGEESEDFYIIMHLRGGDDPQENAFDCDVDILSVINYPADYLKGFITAMMSIK